MNSGTQDSEAEITVLRIITSNLVGRMAATQNDGGRELLGQMADQCKLAAERVASTGADRGRLVEQTRTFLDEFLKGIRVA